MVPTYSVSYLKWRFKINPNLKDEPTLLDFFLKNFLDFSNIDWFLIFFNYWICFCDQNDFLSLYIPINFKLYLFLLNLCDTKFALIAFFLFVWGLGYWNLFLQLIGIYYWVYKNDDINNIIVSKSLQKWLQH